MEVYENRARKNYRRKQKCLAKIRKISGIFMFLAIFGIIGTAGASDNGAAFEAVLKQFLIFGSLFIGSYAVWYFTGGSDM